MIGFEPVPHDLEIHQQRVRGDVICPQRLPVELCRVLLGHIEIAVVDQQVTADFVNAGLTHQPQHLPYPFRNQERVPVATYQEVAVEASVLDFAQREDVGRPFVRGTEEIEADEGRQQLHRRCRVARHAILPPEDDLTAVDILDENAERIVRDLADIENMANRLR
jgi:hypothetical protein